MSDNQGKFDYMKIAKYLIENKDKVLDGFDIYRIDYLVEIIKDNILFEIANQVIQGNGDVKRQIEEAQKVLQARIKFLQEQDKRVEGELDFNAREQEEGIPAGILEKGENTDELKREKVSLEKTLKRLENVVGIIEKPEEFIKSFLENERSENADNIKRIMKYCEEQILNESIRTGDKGIATIFTKTESGCVINPEPASTFLSVVSNPQMLDELAGLYDAMDEYDKAVNERDAAESTQKTQEQFLENQEKTKKAFDEPNVAIEIGSQLKALREDYIAGMNTERALRNLNLPTEITLGQQIKRWFLGFVPGQKKKMEKEQDELETRKTELRTKDREIKARIAQTKEGIAEKYKSDPTFKTAYDVYVEMARQERANAVRENKDGVGDDLKRYIR